MLSDLLFSYEWPKCTLFKTNVFLLPGPLFHGEYEWQDPKSEDEVYDFHAFIIMFNAKKIIIKN